MTNTIFQNLTSAVGLVQTKNTSTLELKNVHFKQCEIGQQFEGQFTEGGALSIKNSRLTLTNSVFEGVKSENGACVYSDTRISFFSSLRERLLALPTALDMSISNCRFLDNQASSSGGVLFLKNVNTQILNSQFL